MPKKLIVGQRLKNFPAGTFNQLVDLLGKVGMFGPPPGDGDAAPGSDLPILTTPCKNVSGQVLVERAPVGISQSAFTAPDIAAGPDGDVADEAILSGVPVEVVAPNEVLHGNAWGLTVQPVDAAAPNDHGHVIIAGFVWARVNFTNVAHKFATISSGDTRYLKSALSGAPILCRKKQDVLGAGTLGAQWALIHLSSAGGGGTNADLPIIYIANVQGPTLFNRSIVGIGAPLIQPNGSFPTPDQLPNQPLFYSAPVSATKPFAILLADVANNGIVQAMTIGTWAIQVAVTDITHQWAIPQDGNNVFMLSSNFGPCRILWKQFQDRAGNAALGPQWAFVQTPWVDQTSTDIRGLSYGTISAAVMHTPNEVIPGTGFAILFNQPTPPNSPIGTKWIGQGVPERCENWMAGEIVPNKPLLLRFSRNSDTGEKIYTVIAEGCKALTLS